MSELKADMAFEIGDLVYFIAATNDETRMPKKFIVIERFVHQCHGGVQRHYKVDGRPDIVPEIALTKDRPKFDPIPTEEVLSRALQEAKWSGMGNSLKKPE